MEYSGHKVGAVFKKTPRTSEVVEAVGKGGPFESCHDPRGIGQCFWDQ